MRGAESKGTARAIDNKPLVNHKRYYDYDPNDKYDDELRYKQYSVRFDVESAGEGFGIAANGYGIAEYGKGPGFYYSNNTQTPSIPVVKDVKYDLGLYLQGEAYKGSFKVYLEDKNGELNSNVVEINGIADSWKNIQANSRLCVPRTAVCA